MHSVHAREKIRLEKRMDEGSVRRKQRNKILPDSLGTALKLNRNNVFSVKARANVTPRSGLQCTVYSIVYIRVL